MSKLSRNMTVAKIVKAHPETAAVFLKHGCPDMSRGFFSVMAKIMRVKWAARMHKIPIDELMIELEQATAGL